MEIVANVYYENYDLLYFFDGKKRMIYKFEEIYLLVSVLKELDIQIHYISFLFKKLFDGRAIKLIKDNIGSSTIYKFTSEYKNIFTGIYERLFWVYHNNSKEEIDPEKVYDSADFIIDKFIREYQEF
jgi:hypothetical protein